MYVHLRPMFLASNVQLSDWLRQIRPQMYSCLIGSDLSDTCTFEADSQISLKI